MNFKNKIGNIIKNNRIFLTSYIFFGSLLIRIISLFVRKKENQILFVSMSGDIFGGSPRVLFEKIYEKYGNQYNYIWAFNDPKKYNIDNVEKVKIDTFKYFLRAIQSNIWITDVNIERGLSFKTKHNFYVNTWHGSGPKSGVKSRKDNNFDKIDMLTVDGEYEVSIFNKFYGLTRRDNLYFYGRPREDSLFEFIDEKTQFYKNEFNLFDKKVIFFCPTWRENGDLITDEEHIFGLNFKKMHELLGDDYVFIFHGHHLSDNNCALPNYSYFINLTNIDDINALFLASDMIITDYSSVMFDFLLLNRPVYCFAPDYDEFNARRGLMFDLKNEIPFGAMTKEEEIFNAIEETDDLTLKKYQEFLMKYIKRGPDSAGKIISKLEELGILKKGENDV